MIQYEVLHAKLTGELAGIEGRAVVLLVGFELVAVGIQAESLAHHPVGMRYVGAVELIVRLIAQTGKHGAVGQLGTESVLLLLGGMYVEAREHHVAHAEDIAILKLMKRHTLRHLGQLLLGKHHADDGLYDLHHLVVAIYIQHALIALALRHHAYDPYNAEYMVGVGMCHEQVMDAGYGYASLAQLTQHAVAAASINEQTGCRCLQHETSIVALSDQSVASAKHCYSVHSS